MPNKIERITTICLYCGDLLPPGKIKFCCGYCKNEYNKEFRSKSRDVDPGSTKEKKTAISGLDRYAQACRNGLKMSYGEWIVKGQPERN